MQTLLCTLTALMLAALNLRADDPVLPIPEGGIKSGSITEISDFSSIYEVTGNDGSVHTGHTVSFGSPDNVTRTTTIPDNPGDKSVTTIRFSTGRTIIFED